MSNEKFTPGEWEVLLNEVHDDIFDHLEYHIWKSGENRSIVRFETWDKTRFAESKANAALISAAPDMYKFISWLGSVEGQCAILSKDPEIVRRVHKLLKKARGEE